MQKVCNILNTILKNVPEGGGGGERDTRSKLEERKEEGKP